MGPAAVLGPIQAKGVLILKFCLQPRWDSHVPLGKCTDCHFSKIALLFSLSIKRPLADSEKLPVQRHRITDGLKSPQEAEVPPVEKKSKKPKKKEKKHKEKEREKEKRKEREKKTEEEEDKKVTLPNSGHSGLNMGINSTDLDGSTAYNLACSK